jgi:hypothetical protein
LERERQYCCVQIGVQAIEMWKAWFDVNQSRFGAPTADRNQQGPKWERPPTGWIKINVDAGFVNDKDIYSTSCCIRSDQGVFVAAQNQWKRAKVSVYVAPQNQGVRLSLL